ncbi:hypothetical protein G7046_g928 [Stylonectria norvegica]|nr:hypothetical protein G7046_g928 [Stylonectria norvegica]
MPMPDGLQMHGSRRRAERQTSSCTECRRRKQKCSQGQPCTNCVRRFPQPPCEYKSKSPKRFPQSSVSQEQTLTIALREGPYSHLNLAGVQDAILQVAENNGRIYQADTPESFTTSSPSATSEYSSFAQSPLEKPSSPWVPFRVAIDEDHDPETILESLRVILERRLTIANLISEDDWSVDDARYDPRSVLQSQDAHRPVQLPVEGSMEQFRYLPMAPTKMNKELVRIHLQLLCRFKVSVDGSPAPNNPFMKHWIPFCVQDPLLLQIILFTSACFFSETGHIPKTLAMMHKGMVYHMLNERLRSEATTQTSDASILGVVQMVVDSWYWGATADLKAHIRGLKQMIRLRGGLHKLGMHGYISKTIIIHDVVMALAHEIEPSIYGHVGYEFEDPIMMPFHIALNTPLIFAWPTFTGCANSLQLHPSTAMILDDMRYLFETVLSLPEEETIEDLQKMVTAAGWISDRIAELPEDTPRHTPDGSSPPADSPESYRSPRSDKSSPSIELPDLMYRCVRMTAMVYCRAILNRTPISAMCSEMDFLKIWGAAWQVGLPTWKATIGIFVWVMLAIVPGCHSSGPARFVKTLMVAGFMTVGVDNWHIAMDVTKTAFKLQKWLAGGVKAHQGVLEKGLSGGESVVDKYGFAIKDALPDIQMPLDE